MLKKCRTLNKILIESYFTQVYFNPLLEKLSYRFTKTNGSNKKRKYFCIWLQLFQNFECVKEIFLVAEWQKH